RPTLVRGVGEHLTDVENIPALPLVIAHTRRMLPTLDVFGELNMGDWGRMPNPARNFPAGISATGVAAYLHTMRNDLEAPAIRLQPQIGDLLGDIRAQDGCLIARMSGSGAACFGLFEKAAEAEAASSTLEAKGWWSTATRLAQ